MCKCKAGALIKDFAAGLSYGFDFFSHGLCELYGLQELFKSCVY